MTTEERIAQIAAGFGQGIQNYQTGQQRQQQQSLQEEALRRQQALQSIEAANQLSTQSGRMINPAQVQPLLASGNLQGLGELLQAAPQSEKAIRDQRESERLARKMQLDEQKTMAEIAKLQQGGRGGSYKEQLQVQKLEKELAKQSDPLEKLGAEGKKMVGIANEGLNAVLGMQQAIESGVTPKYIDPSTPLVGKFISDDPFTSNQRAAAEMFGRLQSGGAINKEEEARFVAMGPRPGDNPAVAKAKLVSQRKALEDRLRIMGVTPEILAQAGVQRRSSVAQPNQAPLQAPTIINEAQAADPEYQEYLMLMQKAGR